MEPNNSSKNDLQSVIDEQIGKTTLEKTEPKTLETNTVPNQTPQVETQNIIQPKIRTEPVSEIVSNVITPEVSVKDELPPLKPSNTMPNPMTSISGEVKKPGIIPTHPEEAPIKLSEVKEPPREMTPADNVQLSTLRTYKADVNSTVNKDKITTAKVLIAEQKRKEKEEAVKDRTSIENPVNKAKLGLSAILIAFAVIVVLAGTFMFLTPKPSNDNQQIPINKSEINFDSQAGLLVSGKTKTEISVGIKEFLEASYKENSINELILYTEVQEEEALIRKRVSTAGLFNILEFNPPQIFIRNLSNDYVFGTYYLNSDSKPFMLLKIEDFANTYSSLFDYEKTLIVDMRKVFGGFSEIDLLAQLKSRKVEQLKQEVATSTVATTTSATSTNSNATSSDPVNANATSTEPVQKIDIDEQIANLTAKIQTFSNFVDIILQNNDARAVLSSEGEPLFYYAFIDDKWILFADDVEVLKELKRRIRETNLIR